MSGSPTGCTGTGEQASLRRLDWRFLLPGRAGESAVPFRRLLLLGGPPGLDRRAVEAGLAEEVSTQLCASRPPDAVAVLHDSPVGLAEVATQMPPGAVLYFELARRGPDVLRQTPARLRRRLRALGLTSTGLYWAAPSFDQTRRYVPLDSPAALHWYFASLFVAGTPAHRLIEWAARGLSVAGRSPFGRVAPCWSVTAVAGREADPTPAVLALPGLPAALRAEAAQLRPLLLTSGQDDASRMILLPFAPGGREPAAVVKIATDPAFNQETELEQAVLAEVRGRLGAPLAAGVSEPLASLRLGELAVAVERCAPGRSLWASSGGWGTPWRRKLADLALGADWLTQFHIQTTASRRPWDERALDRWVLQPFAAYQPPTAGVEAATHLAAAAAAYARTLMGSPLPLVWQHNDFAPWNLFRQGERLTVIDWEMNRDWERTRAGPALCDLLYFVTYWYHVAQHLYTDAAEMDGLDQLWLARGAGPAIGAARRVVRRYMQALQIDPRFLPLLLVYLWVERAGYSQARAGKLQGRTRVSCAGSKFARYVGWLAAHTDQLFDPTRNPWWLEEEIG